MVQRTKKQCSIDGCSRAHEARGLCRVHYRRWMKNGTTDLTNQAPDFCTLDGCSEEHYGRGYCSKHYQRWYKYGDPTAGVSRYSSPEESFLVRTQRQGDCLAWTGSLNQDGYGQIRWNGRMRGAHRYAWTREYGQIPDGMFIDHICHNPACVNVDHLRLATNQENLSHRSYQRKTSSTGHRNVYPHGSGWRVVIGKDGKSLNFGSYRTLDEAVQVANRTRKELFGDFAGRG